MSALYSRAQAEQSADELLGALTTAIVEVDAVLKEEPRDEPLVHVLDRRIAGLRVALAAKDYPASA